MLEPRARHHLPLSILFQRHKRPDFCEGFQPLVLIGAQHGHDGMTKSFQVAEERSSHAFTIHHHSHGCCFPFDLMRASQNLGKSHGQVLVSPMRRGFPGIPLVIMQEHQCTTP